MVGREQSGDLSKDKILKKIRKSIIAGSWYPGNPAVLKSEIAAYFQNVPDRELSGNVVGVIAPHAGYVYSGQVAAYAYKLIHHNKYDAVILVGPSHRVAFRGVSIYSEGAYETPLGVIPINEKLADEIKNISRIIVNFPAAHVQEHSLEIQLPFLQVALGDFSFVPLVMGEQNAETCYELADVISQVARERNLLIVASSDLSHFYDYEKANQLDGRILQYIQDDNVDGLLDDLIHDKVEACGGGPMVVLMMAANKLGAGHSLLLKYLNSGDVTGDKNSVVGYASAVYYR